MSHFTKNSKANIVDSKAFVEAMKELGYTRITEGATITAWDGKKMKVDIAVSNGKYSIGLVKNSAGKYDLVGDFQCFGWEMTSKFRDALKGKMSDVDIQNLVLKLTTKHTIARQYKNKGFMTKFVEDKAGNIHMTLTRFA